MLKLLWMLCPDQKYLGMNVSSTICAMGWGLRPPVTKITFPSSDGRSFLRSKRL